jgi:RND family efflux transporter MFP subunit
MSTKFMGSRGSRAALGIVIVAGVVVAAGAFSRHSQSQALHASAEARTVPTVKLLAPTTNAASTLELPARVEAWARAPIYARTSGYLQSYKVDIGQPVKAGQVLAIIETPDVDQQLLQAQGELAVARSTLALADTTAARWKTLRAVNAVSAQEAEEKLGDSTAKRASVQALSANVERMQQMQRYAKLIAPFDGVVTARNTDVGALISVGGAAGSELFVVSDLSRLRVYVNVPQRQIALIKPGAKAQLSVPERDGKTYAATVVSLAESINTTSGAMLVQLSVDNAAHELVPGAFANVRFDLPGGAGTLSVPPGSLIYGKNGVHVATVDSGNHVMLKPVTLGRDLGSVVEIASGIAPNERVIDSPPDGIANGDQVQVAPAAGPALASNK